jgi:uncharacterized protein YutE (UPF0331/DUF86 family)
VRAKGGSVPLYIDTSWFLKLFFPEPETSRIGELVASEARVVVSTLTRLETASQIHASNHILSAHFGMSAEDYEDVLRQLVKQGVIDNAMGSRLKGLGGFRNILVHGYLRVDPERVAEFLARAPQDFTDYVRAVRGWLERVTG